MQDNLAAQRGHMFGWVPVCLAAGIGIYFSVPQEVPQGLLLALFGGGLGGLALALRFHPRGAPLVIGASLVALGIALAGLRAHHVAEPVLGFRYYGPVEGRIVAMDRSGSDALRLTLDRVVLFNLPPERTPARVRISLHGEGGGTDPRPGLRILATAHLSPPGGPVEPGGFDFQRHAWFQRLGAVGYTRVPVLALEPPARRWSAFGARVALSKHVQARLPGEAGAFAAAIMTGDRAGMGQETLRALRVSNLAHLLAISGLHMGLLAGFVFALVRLCLVASSWVSLRVPAKKIAAGVALGVAAFYLALSGGNVATERAFIMVAVVLLAVIFDRRALSLRAVALAAVIVLVLRPEALLGPGFQMSFAATTALIAVFAWLRDRDAWLGPRWVRPVTTVFVSSLVAGVATAPFAAAHFNQIAHFGLVANLLSVPLMGALVMPAAVMSVCLMPLGLDWIALWVMGQGLGWILGVAHWVAGLDGARGVVVSPGPLVLPMLAVGGMVLLLWQGRSRVMGLVPILAAFWLWSGAERPDVLISEDGSLVGVLTGDGRALSKARGAGFVALNWLENDGDRADQATASARWTGRGTFGGIAITALAGKRDVAAFAGCDAGEIVVMGHEPDPPLGPVACRVIAPSELRATGAVSLAFKAGEVRITTARQRSGARLWNSKALRAQ
ncbi:ComEC/Rec2 family competence protein [Roseovarius sp. SCSIO 43702]|uniref:ComEC/Rec2 family competence protein n=1 Tax=Roseovarius sp. SCSIO 43702 TaxID=2823043 RepID=UPI0038F69498